MRGLRTGLLIAAFASSLQAAESLQARLNAMKAKIRELDNTQAEKPDPVDEKLLKHDLRDYDD